MKRENLQRGVSMPRFLAQYGTEAQCLHSVIAARWPQGFRCPRCDAARHSVFERQGRRYWQCGECRHQTTAIAGTIFQASKLPLTGWFLAIYLLAQAKNNLSALALMRHLGVSYKTAWSVKHKLMQVMLRAEDGRVLQGRVEIAAADLRAGPAAQGGAKPYPFIVAIQADSRGQPQFVRLAPMPENPEALEHWTRRHIAADAAMGSRRLQGLPQHAATEQRTPTAPRSASLRWPGSLVPNIRAAIAGTYHAVDAARYGHRYLGEVQYRYNHRSDLRRISRNLLVAAARTPAQPLSRLRAAE